MERYILVSGPARRYGFFSFCLDLLMICLTCGLWIIWIIIREIRRS